MHIRVDINKAFFIEVFWVTIAEFMLVKALNSLAQRVIAIAGCAVTDFI